MFAQCHERCNESLRLVGGRSPGSQTPGDLANPRALDNEELFIVEGSQKITWRNVPTAENSAKYKGLIEIMPRIPSENTHEQPKHLLCTLLTVCMPTCRQTSGTQREVQKYQQNLQKACHCRCRRRARPLPLRHVSRERSDENRPQDPESTQSRRNCAKFVQKAILELTKNMYPLSNQVLRDQERRLHDHKDVHDQRGTAGICRCTSPAPATPQTCTVCTVRNCRDSCNHGCPPLCR